MIFCFTGTGNSLHVAKRIARETSDTIVMINETEMEKGVTYQLVENEQLGFVLPIYWGGIPSLVEKFVKQMNISVSSDNYIFAVCTYGLMPQNNMYELRRGLKKKGLNLQYTNEVRMVDNYIVGYDTMDEVKCKEVLKAAETKIDIICNEIQNKASKRIRDFFYSLTYIPHLLYKYINHQKGFYVTDACINCQKCEYDCPSKAIHIQNNKPVWNENCTFCLGCIHNCPVEAIQYGKSQGRKRYRFVE